MTTEHRPMERCQREAPIGIHDANGICLIWVGPLELNDAIAFSQRTCVEDIDWIVVGAQQFDHRVAIVPDSDMDGFLRETA